MSLDSTDADTLRDTANELYWNSGDTVDQIARELGISRNAMYSSVRPIPAGASCVHCDEPLLFTNRTSRAARTALCPVCEVQITLGEDLETLETTGPSTGAVRASPVPPPSEGAFRHLKEELAQVPPERAAMIGGAAALGAAVGAAAVRLIRRR
jgi:hypothetical protein